jgi:butyrate kinase
MGGLAYSETIVNFIIKRVEFIFRVEIIAGENDL